MINKNMITNKIIFIWLLFTPFFCLSQTNDDTDVSIKEGVRKFTKDGLSLLLKPNEKATYNIYFKNNHFYWEVEIDLRVVDEHLRDPNIKEMLKNGSYDYGYHMASAFLSFNKDIKKTFELTDIKYIYISMFTLLNQI